MVEVSPMRTFLVGGADILSAADTTFLFLGGIVGVDYERGTGRQIRISGCGK